MGEAKAVAGAAHQDLKRETPVIAQQCLDGVEVEHELCEAAGSVIQGQMCISWRGRVREPGAHLWEGGCSSFVRCFQRREDPAWARQNEVISRQVVGSEPNWRTFRTAAHRRLGGPEGASTCTERQRGDARSTGPYRSDLPKWRDSRGRRVLHHSVVLNLHVSCRTRAYDVLLVSSSLTTTTMTTLLLLVLLYVLPVLQYTTILARIDPQLIFIPSYSSRTPLLYYYHHSTTTTM